MPQKLSLTHHDYIRSIDALLDNLQGGFNAHGFEVDIEPYAGKLTELFEDYRDDESLGIDRYKLYEAQAYVKYIEKDLVAAQQAMTRAVQMKGSSFTDAENFLRIIKQETPRYIPADKVWLAGVFITFLVTVVVTLAGAVIYMGKNWLEGFGMLWLLLGPLFIIAHLFAAIPLLRQVLKRRHQTKSKDELPASKSVL